jgi:type III secretory pathway component EscT
MFNWYENHPLASAQGVFALALWSVYSLYAALSYPDVLTSVLIGAFFGFVASLAVVFNFRYWRLTVLLASFVYLLLYVIRIVRMTTIAKDLSFLSALSFYYGASWRVAVGAFEEKGWAPIPF